MRGLQRQAFVAGVKRQDVGRRSDLAGAKQYAFVNMTYWAHSGQELQPGRESHEGWQRLSTHLEAVAHIAGELALAAHPQNHSFADLVRCAGMLHDFGKYTERFQRMLDTGQGHPQHAIHGAMLAYFGAGGEAQKPTLNSVTAAIAGHHAGLADWSDLGDKLRQEDYQREARELFPRAAQDCPELGRMATGLGTQRDPSAGSDKVRLDLIVRILFSCIVDADRLDSAGRAVSQKPLRARERLQLLRDHISALQQKSPDGRVKEMRAQVLRDCLDAAEAPGSLFSLSVPTGGGKTLAAMAFALRRAALSPQRFRRVIVVIPYLSIIEQNARVYSDLFGQEALLEHHSGSMSTLTRRDDDHFVCAAEQSGGEESEYQETGLRPETENWDSPFIVTTSVRFFESLFSNRPSDLRRVHNIARSIVILDEVQTLPRRLLGPLLEIMKELSDNWGTNFVFSTATQPAFERPKYKRDLRWPAGTLTEIVRQPAALRQALKRAELCWEIDRAVSWRQVAERMASERQCLAIVNLRDHAGQLYTELLRMPEAKREGGIFHLSTRMCAAHRLRVLDTVRERLRKGLPCHVVSTQLIEAGVDVDFPLVLRALAPLDSIVQAAGRADREGKLTAALGRPGGRVVIFRPEDNKMPPNEYEEAAGITEALAKQQSEDRESVQVDSADAIERYFERYYGESGTDLGKQLIADRDCQRFATLAGEFEMISSRTRDVFVPDDEDARKAIASLRFLKELGPALWRKLQRHVVGLNPSEFEKAKGVLEPVLSKGGEEIWIAVDQAYDPDLGLIFDLSAESLVS